MVTRHQRKPKQKILLAKAAVRDMFVQADRVFSRDRGLAKKHVHDARKTAMKFKITLGSGQRRSFCKGCGSFLKQGKNVRVRMTQHNIVYTCLECNNVMRIGKQRR